MFRIKCTCARPKGHSVWPLPWCHMNCVHSVSFLFWSPPSFPPTLSSLEMEAAVETWLEQVEGGNMMFSMALFIHFVVSSCVFKQRSAAEGAASSAGKSTHYCLRTALEDVKVWISTENKETKLLCILSVVEFNGVMMQEQSCYSIKYNFKAFSSCLACFCV